MSCLLLCCIFEGSKNHDPKRKLPYTSIVNPWPVQYWVRDVIERVYRVISPGISHVVYKTSWLKQYSRWFGCLFSIFAMLLRMLVLLKILIRHSICDETKRINRNSSLFGNCRMFWPRFIDLQNFILLVRTVPFFRKIIFISLYRRKIIIFCCTN